MSEQPSFKPPPFFRPVEVDLFNPKASFLQSVKEGNRYFVRFEITRELWELFEEPDPSLRLRGPLYRVYDDERDKTPEQVEAKPEKPKREKKPPKPGTDENGHYWNRMEKGNYFAVPGVAEVLGCQPIKAEVNEAIRKAFGVSTRREIEPDSLEAWAEEKGLINLVTVSRTARARQ